MKTALITGATGQDASYLAELLLAKGYRVFATTRRVASEHDSHYFSRIAHLVSNPNYRLLKASLESYHSLYCAVQQAKPDEVYHLAAQSFVSYSFDDEFSTMRTNVEGTHSLLDICRKLVPSCKFYFAASSEMFGQVEETPQRETTRFHPRSIYGVSKCAGFELTRHYRERYGMFCCSGILFNHESSRRGQQFVTRKISLHVAAIALGLCKGMHLGNLDAKRDWGHARDYTNAMHLMLQHEVPGDWVVATGETHSVRDFIEAAFQAAPFRAIGAHIEPSIALDPKVATDIYVALDPKLVRPAEVDLLLGDSSKIRAQLGWKPQVDFQTLVRDMVTSDIELLKANPTLANTLGKPA